MTPAIIKVQRKLKAYGPHPAPGWFMDYNPVETKSPAGLRPSYEIETAHGLLHVTFFRDWTATRFEDPKRAVDHLDCNPFSGKWNFHGPEHETHFRFSLSTIAERELPAV